MVSGNPPRRSKSNGDGVTIDLPPEDVTSTAGVETPAPTTETASETAPADPVAAMADAAYAAEPESPYADPDGDVPPAVTEAPEPVTAPRPSSSTPSLVAAGILGGLIALVGAGSIQYAGYLPALSSSTAPAAADTSALAAEVESLKQQIANLPTASSAIDPALEQRITALEGTIGTNPADAALSEKVSALTAGLEQLQSAVTAGEQARTAGTDDLAKRLDEAEKKINEPSNDVAVAKAIAAAGLKSAVDRGGPFLAELDTLAGIAPEDPSVIELRKFAATGVLSRADLARQFPDTATAILDAIQKMAPGQSFTDRLMTSAMSLVKVRPVGNVEGEGPEAIVARMEEKLKNGDLKGAAIEWNGLPEDGKAASTTFKAALDDRIRVEELMAATMSKAVAVTGNQG